MLQVEQGLGAEAGGAGAVASAAAWAAREAAVSWVRRRSSLAGWEGSVWMRSLRIGVIEGGGLVEPGWRGARPRGVSSRIRKWPVKGGPSADGRVSASIWIMIQTVSHYSLGVARASEPLRSSPDS